MFRTEEITVAFLQRGIVFNACVSFCVTATCLHAGSAWIMTSTSTLNHTIATDHQPFWTVHALLCTSTQKKSSDAACNGNHLCSPPIFSRSFESVASNMNRSHKISITASQRRQELRRDYHTTFDVWFIREEAAFEEEF